jgi:Tetratricopeptide repeat
MLGPDHPDTATSLNNLGALLQELGQLEAARLYLERALRHPREGARARPPHHRGSLTGPRVHLTPGSPCLFVINAKPSLRSRFPRKT